MNILEEFSRPSSNPDVRLHMDAEASDVDRRFRLVFALGALSLIAINAVVGLIALYEQSEIRQAAVGIYDQAFVPAADIYKADVGFQHFVDARSSAIGEQNVAAVNILLDPVVDALSIAAERAGDAATRQERLDARQAVLAFEAVFYEHGPALWSRLRQTQDRLDVIAAHALEQGQRARTAIEATSRNCRALLAGSIAVGLLLGLITLVVLRRSIAASTLSRISRMANYDAVTGLPNRRLLHRRLTEKLRSTRRAHSGFAVLTVDLDRFKHVNDTLGHKTGDAVLSQAAERIRRVGRRGDLAARFGGDEFVVLLDDIRRPSEAAIVAARLVEAIAAPFEIDGHCVLIGASIGIALAPQHGDGAEDLLRNSDLALYLAKQGGKAQFRFFKDELNKSVQARRLLELDLREAVLADEIDVHFQPVVDIASREIVACEALARWNREGVGPTPPSVFVPIAEESGLIAMLGANVLRKACQRAAQWPSPIRVAVNLSARQFQSGDLVALVSETLRVAGLPASRLELEITETILVADNARTVAILNALRGLGVQIALDDFGTGYSSLSYLTSFPFDRIKIDRSFVADLATRRDAAAIVRAVTQLAAELGMATTAEGVETASDLEWLSRHGCGQAQGFLFSAPVPADQFEALLRAAPQTPGSVAA